MLFSSLEFILLFLPLAVLGFYLTPLPKKKIWIILCSCFFYSFWSVKDLGILLVSAVINYVAGFYLLKRETKAQLKKPILMVGLFINLSLLMYFKYCNFFIDNLNSLLGIKIQFLDLILPLGISFYTFQKIGFLVDCYKGFTSARSFTDYLLLVTFFPHLIAGPIVLHNDLIPQTHSNTFGKPLWKNINAGLVLFGIGLFKKIQIADRLSQFSTAGFSWLHNGHHLNTPEAWVCIIAYTLQIYFDFSGYSDMALGLARILGLNLPVNFNSPYHATSIIDFWRRWHITLSEFLKTYVYIPLGGNRQGKVRRYIVNRHTAPFIG